MRCCLTVSFSTKIYFQRQRCIQRWTAGRKKKSGVTVEFAKSQNVLRRNELREYGCRWEALAQHLLMIMDATPPTEIRVTLTRIIL